MSSRKPVWWNHTTIPGPTSVNKTAIPYISKRLGSYWCRGLFTDVGPGIFVWFRHTDDDILHAACFCALYTSEHHPYVQLVSVLLFASEQHPYITSFFFKFLSLFLSFFVICILCRHSCTGKVCMISNRVYVELLFDSNCVSMSFLEKRGCSQLIIESRRRMD